MTITQRAQTAAPYRPGDHVQALSNRDGATVLLTAAVVTDVRPSADRDRPWTITYRDPYKPDGTKSVNVDEQGRDLHHYVERARHTLPWTLSLTPAAQVAIAVQRAVRHRGVVGALAATTGGDNIAVILVWPNGRDRVIAAVDVYDGTPHIVVGAYNPDHHPDDPPAWEHTTSDPSDAAREIARLYRAG